MTLSPQPAPSRDEVLVLGLPHLAYQTDLGVFGLAGRFQEPESYAACPESSYAPCTHVASCRDVLRAENNIQIEATLMSPFENPLIVASLHPLAQGRDDLKGGILTGPDLGLDEGVCFESMSGYIRARQCLDTGQVMLDSGDGRLGVIKFGGAELILEASLYLGPDTLLNRKFPLGPGHYMFSEQEGSSRRHALVAIHRTGLSSFETHMRLSCNELEGSLGLAEPWLEATWSNPELGMSWLHFSGGKPGGRHGIIAHYNHHSQILRPVTSIFCPNLRTTEFSPDGNFVVASAYNGPLLLYKHTACGFELHSRLELRNELTVAEVSMSPDSKSVAVITEDFSGNGNPIGTLHVWTWRSGEVRQLINGYPLGMRQRHRGLCFQGADQIALVIDASVTLIQVPDLSC